MIRPRAIVFCVLLLCATRQGVGAQQPIAPQAGDYQLFKFQQHIGDEHYEVRRAGATLALTSDFTFTDRGTPVPLHTDAEFQADLTPRSFRTHGKTARESTIDRDIELRGATAIIKDGDTTTNVVAPRRYFMVGGYAPVSMQMMLVKYMLRHGLREVSTLPSGTVRLERRGQDVVRVNARRVPLTRYTVSGLIWGRETLWVSGDGDLAGLVSIDAEFDHFEAVRAEYAPVLDELVASAARDSMLALAADSARVQPRAPGTVAITGTTLIDGTGTPPIQDATVVVMNGRIAAAGPGASVAVPRDAAVIDGRGKFVIPGLWDMHAHFEQVEWGPIYLAAGITTVRDCGNEFDFIKSVRDVLAEGRGIGPRMLLAGIIDGIAPQTLGVITASTEEEGRARVRMYKDAKFDQIKVYSSIRIEVLRAITEEAHRLGMTVTGHVPTGITTEDGVRAGLDQINHAPFVRRLFLPAASAATANQEPELSFDSETAKAAIGMLLEHRVVVDPTLALMELLSRPADVAPESIEPGIAKVAPALAQPLRTFGAPPERAAQAQREFRDQVNVVRELHRAGVPIVAGTDQTVPGHSLHRELELYVAAGFTPMEALQAATTVPAAVMGLSADTGTLRAGMRADLVILGADPLADIKNTRAVLQVMSNGRLYNPAPLWQLVDFVP